MVNGNNILGNFKLKLHHYTLSKQTLKVEFFRFTDLSHYFRMTMNKMTRQQTLQYGEAAIKPLCSYFLKKVE